MTLVELLITVTIIALLAAFIIPAYNLAIRRRENALVASHLRTAVTAFTMYRSEAGTYPANVSRGVVPPEMANYFADLKINQWWTTATELGGQWDWDAGSPFKYCITIASPTKSTDQMTELDKLVDDGNLSTGNFRRTGSSGSYEYSYILEQ